VDERTQFRLISAGLHVNSLRLHHDGLRLHDHHWGRRHDGNHGGPDVHSAGMLCERTRCTAPDSAEIGARVHRKSRAGEHGGLHDTTVLAHLPVGEAQAGVEELAETCSGVALLGHEDVPSGSVGAQRAPTSEAKRANVVEATKQLICHDLGSRGSLKRNHADHLCCFC